VAGITSAGFVVATLTDIVDSIRGKLQTAFGSTFKVDRPASVVGQVTAIIAGAIASAWEALEAISSLDPDDKEGEDLVALCAVTGTVPLAPRASTVTLTLTGTNGTVVAAGSTVSVTGTRDKFDTDADATLATLTARATLTAYTLGQRRSNGGNSYVVVTAGTSSAGGGPTGTGASIADGSVNWCYLGAGAAAVDVAAHSQALDAVAAAALTLTVIETAVSGWQGVTNLLDAEEGFAVESDPDLRLRRLLELSGGGAGTPDSIRAAVLRLASVVSCHVFNNRTDAVVDGVPAHGIDVVVLGGDDQEILDALALQVDAGEAMAGTVTGTVNDSEGVAQNYAFSRPTSVSIYVAVNVTTNSFYPVDGDAQVKAAIVALAESTHGIGDDVFAAQLYGAVFSVTGVQDIVTLFVGTAPGPVSASVALATRELAAFDTSRVSVT
jgi:uncharacterized phage protein gp47/JayE